MLVWNPFRRDQHVSLTSHLKMGRKRKPSVTRRDCERKFGGQPSPLNITEPPTTRQIIQYGYFLQNSVPDMKDYDMAKRIASEVILIWKGVNPRLPLYSQYYVVKLVDKAFKQAKEINRNSLSAAKKQNLEAKVDKLFDISACTCKLPVRPCNDKDVKCFKENCSAVHIVCSCPPQKKVPIEEREYLRDQRAKMGPKGSFQLGTVDKQAVTRQEKHSKETARTEAQRRKHREEAETTFASTSSQYLSLECSFDESIESSKSSAAEDFQPGSDSQGPYSFLKIPRFAMELIRGDVSSRLGASLVNAFLLDLDAMHLLKSEINVQQIIADKAKIDREKKRVRVRSDEKHKETIEKLLCIGVDGKVDKDTLLYREIQCDNGEIKLKKEVGSEHHLTFTNETGDNSGSYLTHRVIPTIGATGVRLAEEVVSVLEEFDSVQTLKAVLLDNTSTNTGSEGGLVTSLEKKIGHKLHTIGCSLHQNELPLRAVFKYLDGSTKSPVSFSGPLGKLCEKDIQESPQVEFVKIAGDLDDFSFDEAALKDLSNDQRLLLEYVRGISRGQVNQRFAAWKIGPLNHARWLTLAIRLLCLWTRGSYPEPLHDKLHSVVKYIVQVYAVSWFEIKRDAKFHNQAHYIFNMIQRMKSQSDEIQAIAFNNLKYNAFALLPENMLYFMMKSDEPKVRESALKKILSIR